MVYTASRARKARWRKILLAILATAALAWAAVAWISQQLQQAAPDLPDLNLESMAGETVALQGVRGQPAVVNLWATWCPPCRREMPLLQRAQQTHERIHIVFVNQGEERALVAGYLQDQSLQLRNVLLDPLHQYSEHTGARGLPTTFFYDAEGRLVDTHLGELSEKLLAGYLDRLTAD